MPLTYPISYPSTNSHRANYFSTNVDTQLLPQNNSKCMCFTYSKNNIYKPHSAVGMVGTIASSRRARRLRI